VTRRQSDPTLLLAGSVAILLNLLLGLRSRLHLLAAAFALFVLSSGTVYAFALLPLLPLLALNAVLRWLAGNVHLPLARVLLLFVLVGVLLPAGIQRSWSLRAEDQAAVQHEAVWWIGEHIPHNAVVIAGSYLYADLHNPQGIGVSDPRPFLHAHISTAAALDPAIRVGELKQDWQRIDCW
jgi:hypothetical protein